MNPTNKIIFKSIAEYARFVTDVINTKQPELEHIEALPLEDGSIEVTLFFAPAD